MSEIKTIGVYTSGGDAPGMNACIRSVVRTGFYKNLTVKGIYRGYAGMIDGQIETLGSGSVSNIIQRGGTFLKSARSKEFRTPEGRKRAYEQLQAAGIEGLVAIGGDGTFTGAKIFYEEYGIPTVGVPGTIDNDLSGTDYTLGYDTAVNTALEAIDRIRDTAASHDRMFFVEVMGRDAGFIALEAGLAGGAEAVLVPETQTDLPQLMAVLERGWKRSKTSSIVVVAEGDEAGGAFTVAEAVRARFPELDIRVTVLGHTQRGGSPTAADRVLGTELGYAAVEALLAGKGNIMVGKVRGELVETPFGNAIKEHPPMNQTWLKLVEILSM